MKRIKWIIIENTKTATPIKVAVFIKNKIIR